MATEITHHLGSIWIFDGIPVHPLVVHAPVVLLPLIAAGWVLFVFWPSSRRVLGVALVALSAVAAVSAILAVESGNHLADALGRGDTVADHALKGRNVRTLSVVLAIISAFVISLDRSSDENLRRWSGPGASATAVVAALSILVVSLAGHSGAQLAWEGRLPAAAIAGEPASEDLGDDTTTLADNPDSDNAASAASTDASTDANATDGKPAVGDTATTGSAGAEPGAATVEPAAPDGIVDVVLGEWAIITSVNEAPPGDVTFRVRNAGTHLHALRIRTPGSGGDRLEWRSPEVGPGDEITWTVNLAPGLYELSCPVEDRAGDHGDLGMEGLFTVREGARTPSSTGYPDDTPATATTEQPAEEEPAGDQTVPDAPTETSPSAVEPVEIDIAAFAFAAQNVTVPVGTTVVWTNRDPAPHTATGDGFDTGILNQGESASVTFDQPGTYTYICTLHPSMTATITVTP